MIIDRSIACGEPLLLRPRVAIANVNVGRALKLRGSVRTDSDGITADGDRCTERVLPDPICGR